MKVSTVGLDIAKNNFQIHCLETSGRVLLRKRLRKG